MFEVIGDILVTTTLVIAMSLLYFLPSIIAQKKSFAAQLLLLNLLLGWTYIGWVVALIWAFSSVPRAQQHQDTSIKG